ncbi:MAG: hypothetical protein GWN01_08025 [Nitrosopumilaceae archaeon]|nr:hypothetical protein [Nitrosopumilaceae archaeon]NIU00868.1 hypothetical protein [Nitrosopumilaceae archaeon]NIU87321.1 hypothetical protein [Nitrosopumilaceae archaeon]NIV65849.1 hypothetical protein [Nitrosopumilaceae archaeon]NIX61470.1 hypothetical protein [Nitrosopumilaceae archaeon]
MTINLPCKIECFCSINPSESSSKVKEAVLNIFPNMEIEVTNYSIKAITESISALDRIHEVIKRRQSQKTYRRHLLKNQFKNTTWFYLNKQAAFAKKIALCEDTEESPLGPIKVVLTSKNIEEVIKWLVN